MANIRYDLPDDLHWNLKRRAADERITLKELVIKALRYYLEKNPPPPSMFDYRIGKEAPDKGGD
jgi:hypothetical protein